MLIIWLNYLLEKLILEMIAVHHQTSIFSILSKIFIVLQIKKFHILFY